MSDKNSAYLIKSYNIFILFILNHATFCVGRFALAVFCLHPLLPHVGNIGIISKWSTNCTISSLPMVRSPNARFVSSRERINLTNHYGRNILS